MKLKIDSFIKQTDIESLLKVPNAQRQLLVIKGDPMSVVDFAKIYFSGVLYIGKKIYEYDKIKKFINENNVKAIFIYESNILEFPLGHPQKVQSILYILFYLEYTIL